MTVNLLCVLGFDTENELDWNQSFCFIFCWKDKLGLLGNTDLGRILEDVAHGRHTIDIFLHDRILINALCSEYARSMRESALDPKRR